MRLGRLHVKWWWGGNLWGGAWKWTISWDSKFGRKAKTLDKKRMTGETPVAPPSLDSIAS